MAQAGVMAANAALWDRYRSAGELVVGTIAPLTPVEGDLPEDADPSTANATIYQGSPLRWYWAWQEWCNQGLPQATLRITAETGAQITVPGPPKADPPLEPETGCRDRGRPSSIKPWP